MPFLHPDLEAAAATLTPLRDAAIRIGAPDPVAALRQIDCSPQAIRDSARTLSTGRDVLVTARLEFERGAHRAERRWGGEPAAHFRSRADELDVHYRQAAEVAARTAAVGLDLAELLDRLARQTAAQVVATARATTPATESILAGDRTAEAAYQVRTACTTIGEAVTRGVAAITEATTFLDPFTTPVLPG
ncbi:hypothetical protein [Amycolatopsis jiangsuensis]|uniref:Uncharacterized protein n=1 Tax=Amycolatopsis jiangsuensis TaxID=1181879 RepID=A0A840J2H7_9PSEU|nr:hypothetical protein [Amycolatopsis jiangsuensis]MBB4687618.1 hypothetical protein [Amycolatopsis jiangsuensis]